MSHEQMRFQVTSKLIRPNSWITQTVRQRIPNCWARNCESTSAESAATDATVLPKVDLVQPSVGVLKCTLAEYTSEGTKQTRKIYNQVRRKEWAYTYVTYNNTVPEITCIQCKIYCVKRVNNYILWQNDGNASPLKEYGDSAELVMGWVHPWVGLGWVET